MEITTNPVSDSSTHLELLKYRCRTLIATFGMAIFVCSLQSPKLVAHDNAVANPQRSDYSHEAGERMGAKYKFTFPERITAGKSEAIEFNVQTLLSQTEIDRLMKSSSNPIPGRRNGNLCLFAKLEHFDNEGLTIKAITGDHQKLLPNNQNHWTWQIKGKKAGEYLLSLTVSICAEGDHDHPLATPIALNKKITVINGPAGHNHAQSQNMGYIVLGLGIFLFALIFKLIRGVRRQAKDRAIKVLPGGEHHIFISYSKFDREKVAPIIAQLEQAGHKLWVDLREIKGATTWRAEIVKALGNSQAIIFFASNQSYQSEHVGKELAMASDEKIPVIPVALEKCNPQGAGKFVVAGLQRIDAKNLSPREAAAAISKALAQKLGTKTKKILSESKPEPSGQPS